VELISTASIWVWKAENIRNFSSIGGGSASMAAMELFERRRHRTKQKAQIQEGQPKFGEYISQLTG